GRELERFSVRPTTVVVSGPKDLLDSLPSIKTAPISLDGVDRRATRSVSLRPPAGVSIPGPATATVTVLLKPFPRRATPPVDDGPEDDGDAADDGDEGEEAGEEGAAGEHPGGE
ncbi:MAG: CdaR family protein, partial [Armatimonadota bacterium]